MRSRALAVLMLLALATGCPPHYLVVTVDATACDPDQCPNVRVHVTGVEDYVTTLQTQTPGRDPRVVQTVHYYPANQDSGNDIAFKLECIGDDGCPNCYGEGSTVTFDPVTIVLSPEGQ